MMLALRSNAIIISAFCLLNSGAAHASKTFVVIQQKVNPVMQPKTAGDVFKECIGNPICATAVKGAAVYLGVPSSIVSGAIALVPTVTHKGEDSFYSMHVPTGYQYCRVQVRTISIVPATGDRASNMVAGSRPWGVDVKTWTPKQGAGQGRSWIEAEFTIYGVKNEAADKQRRLGKCKPPGPNFMDCRGARGVNHGRPACGTYEE